MPGAGPARSSARVIVGAKREPLRASIAVTGAAGAAGAALVVVVVGTVTLAWTGAGVAVGGAAGAAAAVSTRSGGAATETGAAGSEDICFK